MDPESLETAPNSTPIFQVVRECSDDLARWDYNFKSDVKVKSNGVFNGHGVILLAKKVLRDFRAEHNNFKFGMRYNKCIVPFAEGVKKIRGHFINDQLEGTVRIDFHSGEFILGSAKHSHFFGVLRRFDANQKLMHVKYKVWDQSDEETAFHLDEFGIYHIWKKDSVSTGRNLLSRNFGEVFSCEPEGQHIQRNCYKVHHLRVDLKPCYLELPDLRLDGGQPDQRFSWNLKLNQTAFNSPDVSAYGPECSAQWQTENVVDSVRTWINSMANQTKDPFWRENWAGAPWDGPDSDGGYPISLAFPELLDRSLAPMSNLQVNVTTWTHDQLQVERADWNQTDSLQLLLQDPNPSQWRQTIIVDAFPRSKFQAGLSLVTGDNSCTFCAIGKIRGGQFQGNVRKFGRFVTNPASQCSGKVFPGVSMVTRYENGKPSGPTWRFVVGGGIIYGLPDAFGRLTGDNIAFIYPDLSTVYLGKFANGLMEGAQEASITGFRCQNGITELRFSEPHGPQFQFKAPTNEAFAKRDIPQGEYITLYGGLIMDQAQSSIRIERLAQEREDRNDNTRDSHWYDNKYNGGLIECDQVITIPAALGGLDSYRATLGHKLNHQFKPNCEYSGVLDTPRFGLIRAFFANRDIKQDEELFISYGYSLKDGPQWYLDLYALEKEDLPPPDPAQVVPGLAIL
eukprot:maker-scaffold1195_size56104-snap-gene-0.12 protein:Tk12020 transcript:maker-scaffold1195_size56104-snap-gene-0.12-mRNA-1 annotation:"hypothetical protein TRIADDRAFT_26073"